MTISNTLRWGAFTLFLSACGAPPTANEPRADVGAEATMVLEIIGEWTSEFGEETITAQVWNKWFSTASIITFNNDNDWVITQNAEDAEFFPNTFSSVFWADAGEGSIYYCTSSFGKETQSLAEAEIQSPPDSSDAANGGCGDFPWTKLDPR
jgi:hypothetical protein